MAGFKIKWNAHPKRVSFDIHKVAGIVTAIFLFLTFYRILLESQRNCSTIYIRCHLQFHAC
ncbi:hypothetical protein [Chroococcidiopsis cubana]|uniref:hypothetical protein n=1 Tax=Chroococcidiopsis cubana TaxID=171392 RepID=UPI002ACDEE56|nr:hypothetical protein [Chroococcidiopsis cubana]